METPKTPGQLAYEAYCEKRGWKSFNGQALPAFDAQSAELKQAWEAGAKAAQNAGAKAMGGVFCTQKQEPVMVDGMPRRNRVDLATPTEMAIRDAIGSVEGLGAAVELTEAVTLMTQALDRVADFVEKDGKS